MHVLLLPSWYHTDDKPWRGMFFRDQALALIRHGVRAGVVFVERKSFSMMTPAAALRQRFQIESANEDGIPTVRMRAWGVFPQTTRGGLAWTWLTKRAVRAYVETHGMPDVIHGHGALWGGYAAMVAARELNVPYFITEHASTAMREPISTHAAEVYRNATAVIAVSRALEKNIGDAEVIPNCVDNAFFHLPRFPRSREPFKFLFVGDLVRSKRIDLLLCAFTRQRDARLIIAGAGPEKFPRVAGVEFLGALTREEVREQMWRANALVLPSDFETFGVVLIEALATGLPVIATRCGGPEEIVTTNDGILIDCNDEFELARAMMQIRIRKFSEERLAASAAARFGYDAVAPQILDVYQRAYGNSAWAARAWTRRRMR